MYCSLVYSIVIYFNQICHFSGSFNDDIIGPGEESTTWEVRFPSEIIQLRFKIKLSFCQGQTPPKDNSRRGSDFGTFLGKGSTLVKRLLQKF